MRAWTLPQFGVENLKLEEQAPLETPPAGHIAVDVKAFSLNYRDLLVVLGKYNSKLPLPATPISDAAGVVSAVGPNVTRWSVGDRVVSHFIADWIDGPLRPEHQKSSLGTPGPGLAAERVILPEHAWVAPPTGYSFQQAATLPIAALTAWSALLTEGSVQAGQTVLTLGTGGVSIFAVQIAKALGARVIITSSSDAKLRRARALGADEGINYAKTPDWSREVLSLTNGEGADVVVETGGAGTLNQSMKATRIGGRISLLGVLSGGVAEINTTLILMKRLTVCGIYVDSRAAFERMNAFLDQHKIEPVIDRIFSFEDFPEALRAMQRGEHFGKLVVNVA